MSDETTTRTESRRKVLPSRSGKRSNLRALGAGLRPRRNARPNRSPAGRETFGQAVWLGRETGHNFGGRGCCSWRHRSPGWRMQTAPRGKRPARLLAQVEPRLKAIYERDEFAIRSFTATWLPDGSGYLKLDTPAGESAAEVAHYDAASGQRTAVVPPEKLVLPGSSQPLKLLWFQRAPSGKWFLLHGDVTEGERRSGHWLYEPEYEFPRSYFLPNFFEAP